MDVIKYTKSVGTTASTATMPGLESPGSSYVLSSPELSFYGTGDYREPAVHVQHAAGHRLIDLIYHSHEILEKKPEIHGMPSLTGGETLVLHLVDKFSGFGADVYYTVYDDASVISRRVVYKNGGNAAVMLRRAYSFSLSLPGQDYDVMSLHGGWATEAQIQTTAMHYGVISIDSKRGTSSAT